MNDKEEAHSSLSLDALLGLSVNDDQRVSDDPRDSQDAGMQKAAEHHALLCSLLGLGSDEPEEHHDAQAPTRAASEAAAPEAAAPEVVTPKAPTFDAFSSWPTTTSAEKSRESADLSLASLLGVAAVDAIDHHPTHSAQAVVAVAASVEDKPPLVRSRYADARAFRPGVPQHVQRRTNSTTPKPLEVSPAPKINETAQIAKKKHPLPIEPKALAEPGAKAMVEPEPKTPTNDAPTFQGKASQPPAPAPRVTPEPRPVAARKPEEVDKLDQSAPSIPLAKARKATKLDGCLKPEAPEGIDGGNKIVAKLNAGAKSEDAAPSDLGSEPVASVKAGPRELLGSQEKPEPDANLMSDPTVASTPPRPQRTPVAKKPLPASPPVRPVKREVPRMAEKPLVAPLPAVRHAESEQSEKNARNSVPWYILCAALFMLAVACTVYAVYLGQSGSETPDAGASAADAPEAPAAYRYFIDKPDGTRYTVRERITLNAQGYVDLSAVTIEAASDVEAKAVLDDVRTHFGPAWVGGLVEGSKVVFTVKVQQKNIDAAVYEALLEENTTDFQVVNE